MRRLLFCRVPSLCYLSWDLSCSKSLCLLLLGLLPSLVCFESLSLRRSHRASFEEIALFRRTECRSSRGSCCLLSHLPPGLGTVPRLECFPLCLLIEYSLICLLGLRIS